MAELICNFDATNIDLDPAPQSMLSKIGKRLVSLWVNGYSGICMVMLGCTASGVKFPVSIIWKGVQDCLRHMDCWHNVFSRC